MGFPINSILIGEEASRYIMDALVMPYGQLKKKYQGIRFNRAYAEPVKYASFSCCLDTQEDIHAILFVLAPEKDTQLCKTQLTIFGKGFMQEIQDIFTIQQEPVNQATNAIEKGLQPMLVTSVFVKNVLYEVIFLFNISKINIDTHLYLMAKFNQEGLHFT